MKRLKVSIICGLSIPLGYLLLLSALAPLVGDQGTALLLLPLSWPSHIYYYFFPLDPHRELIMLDGFEMGNIYSLIFGNVLGYSILIYALLCLRDKIEDSFPYSRF
jgi:hypothetical protein